MVFIKAFFTALFTALRAYARDVKMRRDYEEALRENAVFDAAERAIAGAKATAGRIDDAENISTNDVGVLRDWLRARDSGIK